MPIVTLPDDSYTSRSQQMRNKAWIKSLDKVDRSHANGYAFIGNFEKFEATVEAPEGAWFLRYAEDRSGAGVLRDIIITLFQVRGGDVVEVEEWATGPTAGWALRVRDQIADLIEATPEPDVDALLAEREQLLARLAEIDAQLPEPDGAEVSIRQAAQALGVSIRTVQRWAATGKVQAAKDDAGRWVVTITINATPEG